MIDSGLHSRSFAFAAIESISSLQYYCLAAIVILYYDFALTFSQEIERIWQQKTSFVSCIFVLNRYLTCFGYIPVVYFLFNSPSSDEACTRFARFPGSLSTITQFFIVVLLVMRVYALYQGKAWVLWVTIPLGSLTVAIAAWGLTLIRTENFSFGPQAEFKACLPSVFKTDIIFKVSWFINGTFDSVVFFLTVCRTYTLCKEHKRVGMQSGLVRLLLRDGGMFYATLAIANIVNVIFYLIQEDKNAYFEESAGNNSVLTHTISSALLSRLILNLREAGSKVDADSSNFSTRFSSATGIPPENIMLPPCTTFSETVRDSYYSEFTTMGSTAVESIDLRDSSRHV